MSILLNLGVALDGSIDGEASDENTEAGRGQPLPHIMNSQLPPSSGASGERYIDAIKVYLSHLNITRFLMILYSVLLCVATSSNISTEHLAFHEGRKAIFCPLYRALFRARPQCLSRQNCCQTVGTRGL